MIKGAVISPVQSPDVTANGSYIESDVISSTLTENNFYIKDSAPSSDLNETTMFAKTLWCLQGRYLF